MARNLNVKKSSGTDEISPLILIKLVDFVVSPLALLISTTIKYSILPNDWKKVFVSPTHKKGARNHAENCRPISRTSVLCKLMEFLLTYLKITSYPRNSLDL